VVNIVIARAFISLLESHFHKSIVSGVENNFVYDHITNANSKYSSTKESSMSGYVNSQMSKNSGERQVVGKFVKFT